MQLHSIESSEFKAQHYFSGNSSYNPIRLPRELIMKFQSKFRPKSLIFRHNLKFDEGDNESFSHFADVTWTYLNSHSP